MTRSVARVLKLVRVLQTPGYRRSLRWGVAASVEHEEIPFRADYQTVIDVGANRGQFAVFAAERFPQATITCFEPHPPSRAVLERVLRPWPRASVLPFAVADVRGGAKLHVSRSADSSSLLPIGRMQSQAFPGTEEVREMAVETRPLDEVLPADFGRPALLKIDVQGGEGGVLAGAAQRLRDIDAVLVEASFVELYVGQPLVDEIWASLASHGFVCRGMWSASYGTDRRCLQADFVFAQRGFEPFAVSSGLAGATETPSSAGDAS